MLWRNSKWWGFHNVEGIHNIGRGPHLWVRALIIVSFVSYRPSQRMNNRIISRRYKNTQTNDTPPRDLCITRVCDIVLENWELLILHILLLRDVLAHKWLSGHFSSSDLLVPNETPRGAVHCVCQRKPRKPLYIKLYTQAREARPGGLALHTHAMSVLAGRIGPKQCPVTWIRQRCRECRASRRGVTL